MNADDNNLKPKILSLQLFDEASSYIDNKRMYFTYFARVPNEKSISDLNVSKVKNWVTTEMKNEVIRTHDHQWYNKWEKKMKDMDVIYILKNEMLLNISRNAVYIYFPPEMDAAAQKMIDLFKNLQKRNKKTADISLVTTSLEGLTTVDIKLKKPVLDIKRHYNDDLQPMHQLVLDTLKKKDKSALFLFHGIPGTGKSTYIRYLLHHLNKPVIFMPPKLAGDLDTPSFTSFLIRNSNTVFVIEDAEQLIVSREGSRNSSISMLLNLTDGLLGDSLGIQIIATFNTHIKNIDKALLRKGRLTGLYEFKELCIPKSKALVEKIGFPDYKVTQPMTLAEIYNTEEDVHEFRNERTTIGFIQSAKAG